MNLLKNKNFVLIALIIVSFGLLLGATSNPSIVQIFQAILDSDNASMRVSMSLESLKDSTALTNTATYPATLEHETSGTPAAGIGVGVDFKQQTAASNSEVVAGVAAVMTDVTSTSEDAKLVFYTMTAGAAATEKLMVGPTETVANDGSLDQDFRVESDNEAQALWVDAGNDRIVINGFWDSPYQEVTATPYTITAASRATYYVVNYTDTGAASVVIGTGMAAFDGRMIVVKDGELNAGSNNITISTEGSDTIDEAATYVMNANGEAVTLLSDGTNWFIMGANAE